MELDEKALFTSAEVAVLMGWSPTYAAQYLCHSKVPCIKINPRLRLYSAATVRDLMWRRNGRPRTKQHNPYLLTQLIAWFRKNSAAEVPTDRQYAEDREMEKRLKRLLRLPKEQQKSAINDFMKKCDLAKRVVQLLD